MAMRKPVLVRLFGWAGVLLLVVAVFFWYITPHTVQYGYGLLGCFVTAAAGIVALGLWAVCSAFIWLAAKHAGVVKPPALPYQPVPPRVPSNTRLFPTLTDARVQAGSRAYAGLACGVCRQRPATVWCPAHGTSACDACRVKFTCNCGAPWVPVPEVSVPRAVAK